MKKIDLPAVLLFCLVTPFIMTYGIGPGNTPYWLFGIIFLLLLCYLILERLRSFILWAIIILVIGSGVVSSIIVRHRVAPIYQVHDIILQQEAAIRFLVEGKNPYAVSYFNTPLEAWHYSDSEINPALFHFVMMPGYLIFALPFYFISNSLVGYFDGRMPLLVLFFGILILAWKLIKTDVEKKRLFITLLAFNPATLGYFLEGRSDIFVFAFLFWGWYWLEKEKLWLAGIPLGLAFAVKQSAWPIFPFYLAFLWLKKKNLSSVVKNLIPFTISFLLMALPFFAWGPKDFLESTILYLTGNVPNSYPVSGYGWGMVLRDLAIIKDVHAYYPFIVWQIIFCVPIALVLFLWLKKELSVWRLIAAYGIFTFVYWYFSRYFNNSHLAYLSWVFLAAYGFSQKTS
jgi:uncharacterized membrane protein